MLRFPLLQSSGFQWHLRMKPTEHRLLAITKKPSKTTVVQVHQKGRTTQVCLTRLFEDSQSGLAFEFRALNLNLNIKRLPAVESHEPLLEVLLRKLLCPGYRLARWSQPDSPLCQEA